VPLPRIFQIVKSGGHDPNINVEVVSEPALTEEETLSREHRIVEESVKYAKDLLGI
jgi:hypothetical protein